ncbi:MAG: HAMP domain-containing histidine kinase [Bacteroides sp.]|nr:HAMP domain-containing histidine kinase [Ruminococcus flavefaciens]MCM1554582.1 HAMP domain-containing histidine kinase [Bacteroides sp.]
MLNSGRLNFILILFSILIVAASLFFSRTLVEQLKKEERVRVQNWAISNHRQLDMANRVRSIFAQMETEERQYATVWTYVYERVFSPVSPTPKDFDFLMRIMSSNNRPFILVGRSGNIIESHDPDIKTEDHPVFTPEIQAMYSVYPPIVIDAQGVKYSLYFKPSEVFLNLRRLFSDLDSSFSIESVNSISALSVPVLITDESKKTVLMYQNMGEGVFYSQKTIQARIRKMQDDNEPIELHLPGVENKTYYLFYESSAFLRRMNFFTIALLLALLAIIGGVLSLLNLSKKMEQNREWWGMSKETAHQLGTPLSSLLAWLEYYKTKEAGEPMEKSDLAEIEKDVKRIELVTNRFSRIGSVPELSWDNVVPAVYRSVEYLKARSSSRIRYVINVPPEAVVMAQFNAPLIEWVFENLFKNALNAIGDNEGEIGISITESNEHVTIDVHDTGKGMPKNTFKKVFEAGFTTKQRGWGLGLTLSRRIVESYHKGKIFVESSSPQTGTVFRVVLNKEVRKH